MSNSATQNPSNKVGRNSGAGPVGISALQPSAREAERGLQPMQLEQERSWARLALGLGAATLLGAGATVYALQQRRRQRSLRGRLERLVSWA